LADAGWERVGADNATWCFSERRGARAAASVARLGEAVEVNFQLTPSFLCASRAVALLIAYGGWNVAIRIALGFSQEERR
jgi:hypothetical protein